ncbi:MAG: hypothetical protein JXR76_03120 [Deltaproteobacteria bacterium]|nr:hypothetical protein [Deltaproteobacteria bacterium]
MTDSQPFNETDFSSAKELIKNIRTRLDEKAPTAAHVTETLNLLSRFASGVAADSFQMAIELGLIKEEMSEGWKSKWEDILDDVSSRMDSDAQMGLTIQAWQLLGTLLDDFPDDSRIDKAIG